jgi:hypothetical protein
MDAGYVDEEGFLYIMSRSDDVINVAGHRLSAGALEEVGTERIIGPGCMDMNLPVNRLFPCVLASVSATRWRRIVNDWSRNVIRKKGFSM